MRDYLLGKLDAKATVLVEEAYFVDKDYLMRLHAVEDSLIEDYLDGKLAEEDRRLFEAKYYGIDALRKRLEGVKATHQARRPAAAGLAWWKAAAALLVAGAALFLYLQTRPPASPGISKLDAPALLPAIVLHLSPGLRMGADEKARELAIPDHRAPVRLILELPGLKSSQEFQVQLSRVDESGRRHGEWPSPHVIHSTATATGQELVVAVDPAALQHSDYVVEASTADGAVRQIYVFRAIPASIR